MIAQTETAAETKQYSVDEYLELELASETRSEYRNGAIVPMTGGTPNHNRISGNLYITLTLGLKPRPYATFHVDQRLWIPAVNIYTYPDVMVLPQPVELQAGRKDTVVNPCFMAEVLSESTQNYDRGEKFVAYRTIDRFQEYLLIDQYRIHVEHHVRTAAHQWLFSEYDDPEVLLSLKTLGLQVEISALYENIDFAAI
jgi:Uma2 family endonuclease